MAQPSYNELQAFLAVARDRSFTRGYHLYYPSRRQHTPAFFALLEALQYRN